MAPRNQHAYDCPEGHAFAMTFAEEADLPSRWECPRCGAPALRRHGGPIEEKATKPVRTHWDMLRERRSLPELEDILTERLELLRTGQIGPSHLHRARARVAKRSA